MYACICICILHVTFSLFEFSTIVALTGKQIAPLPISLQTEVLTEMKTSSPFKNPWAKKKGKKGAWLSTGICACLQLILITHHCRCQCGLLSRFAF